MLGFEPPASKQVHKPRAQKGSLAPSLGLRERRRGSKRARCCTRRTRARGHLNQAANVGIDQQQRASGAYDFHVSPGVRAPVGSRSSSRPRQDTGATSLPPVFCRSRRLLAMLEPALRRGSHSHRDPLFSHLPVRSLFSVFLSLSIVLVCVCLELLL